jgi:hypothetical protein
MAAAETRIGQGVSSLRTGFDTVVRVVVALLVVVFYGVCMGLGSRLTATATLDIAAKAAAAVTTAITAYNNNSTGVFVMNASLLLEPTT